MHDRATIDFESRSACPIKKTGSWRYSLDPSTEPLCLAFRLPYWDEGRIELWHPEFAHLALAEEGAEHLGELFSWVVQGGLVEAHGAWFELGIWANIMTPRYGWPEVPRSSWRCSAAKAASHSLPRGLDAAVAALGLSIRKDAAGSKVMKKMAKPRKARKAEREKGVTDVLWWESIDLLDELFAYCRQDVLTEEALSDALPNLIPSEEALFLLDQTINERGFRLDRDAISVALGLIAGEQTRLNLELSTLTDGAVAKATQRAQLKAWLQTENLYLEDTQAATLDAYLAPECQEPISAKARQALTLLRALGRSSTAKYESMWQWICPDDRVHGGLLYHGASTGRWTGVGIQPHNLPKSGLSKKMDTRQEAIWAKLKTGDRGVIEAAYGDTLTALSHGLRGVIVASPGKLLYVADYASIEARVLLWQAGEEGALQLFRDGGDLYCDMAASIYDRNITKENGSERALGKVAILGLGYQMGWSKFQATALVMAGITIDDDLAQKTVAAYREKYAKVQQMWWDQEAAAIAAVQCRGKRVECGYTSWFIRDRFLYAQLPSGRCLAYPDPRVDKRPTPWGVLKPSLTYMGVNPYTRQWTRQHSYGGLLVENLTQAISRDIMAEAMVRCESTGIYQPVLSVHDEIVCEAHPAIASVEEYDSLVAECPAWAEGCPVGTESWAGARYSK